MSTQYFVSLRYKAKLESNLTRFSGFITLFHNNLHDMKTLTKSIQEHFDLGKVKRVVEDANPNSKSKDFRLFPVYNTFFMDIDVDMLVITPITEQRQRYFARFLGYPQRYTGRSPDEIVCQVIVSIDWAQIKNVTALKELIANEYNSVNANDNLKWINLQSPIFITGMAPI